MAYFPEGLPGDLSIGYQGSAEHDPRGDMETIRRFNNMIPQSLTSEARLSGTSEAEDCYIYRRNSRRLQELMVDFSYNFVKTYNVVQEV